MAQLIASYTQDGCTMTPGGEVKSGVVIAASVGQKGKNLPVDVRTIQDALNRVPPTSGRPTPLLHVDGLCGPKTISAIQKFQLHHFGWKGADGRVDPGQQTIAKINELLSSPPATAFSGQQFAGQQSLAATGGSVSPLTRAVQATPLALNWVLLTRGQLGLIQTGKGSQFMGPINVHFHLDKATNRKPLIDRIAKVFDMMRDVLTQAPALYSGGPCVNAGAFAEVLPGAFHDSPKGRISFCPSFSACGPRTRAAMIIHECAHFVGGKTGSSDAIGHFARELPLFDGAPDPPHTENYKDLSPGNAVRNAYSYACYAIHAAMGKDLRFGARDTKL